MVINSSGPDTYTNGVGGLHGTADSVDSNFLAEGNAVPDLGAIGDAPQTSLQAPIAVVGMACRLPDECHSPEAFWRFIERGNIAKNRPPSSRFNIDTHVSLEQSLLAQNPRRPSKTSIKKKHLKRHLKRPSDKTTKKDYTNRRSMMDP